MGETHSGAIISVTPGANGKAYRVGITVSARDTNYGDVIARATAVGEAPVKPGTPDERAIDDAAYAAAVKAVRQMVLQLVPAATVIAVSGDPAHGGMVEIDRGRVDGIRPGMAMSVYRGNAHVGAVRVVSVQSAFAECREVEGAPAIRVEDVVRTIAR